MIQLMHR